MFDEGKFPPEMFVCPDHGSWYLDIYRAVDINRAVDIPVDSRNVRMLVSGQLAWAAWAGKLGWDHRPLPWRAGEAHTSVTTSPNQTNTHTIQKATTMAFIFNTILRETVNWHLNKLSPFAAWGCGWGCCNWCIRLIEYRPCGNWVAHVSFRCFGSSLRKL